MRGLTGNETASAVEGLLAWWTLAGVDTAVSESPVNWLKPRIAPASPSAPVTPATPDSLDQFHIWLAEHRDLPDAAWGGRRILPVGQASPRVMIISDMPDQGDDAAGALLSGDAGKLFDAMLRAVGIGRADIYLCSLALSRPPGGMVEQSDEAALVERMRRHIKLVAPKNVLLLGDRTSRALLAANAAPRLRGLSPLNHEGGTVDAIATLHPRLLMLQPAAKAECWNALQHLVKV